MQQQKAPRKNMAIRTAKSAFHVARNVLAVLGVLFVYLLYTGYQQYEDRIAAGDTSCSFHPLYVRPR